jgi:MarR family transcriptional regulator, lower aerobic nicotinate degradation pathway regulator
VALTAAGRKLVESLLPVETACTARTLAPLDPVEQRLLYALLRKVIDG